MLRRWVWTIIAGLMLVAPIAHADGPVLERPVYIPSAKRYFALVQSLGGDGTGIEWIQAYREAETREYKGVRGRLAVVDSAEIHETLLTKFRPNVEAWIGLRYWCGTKKLQWSNGNFFQAGTFQAWDQRWQQDNYLCHTGSALPKGMPDFGPVAYSKTHPTWIVKGYKKHYQLYFIEYPTGKP